MARLARLTLPGYAHHVIQRGNNRQPIFADDADRAHFLALLAEHATRCRVDLHAYVLMDNHFHLLLTPQDGDGLPRMMQAVGRSYVRYFNDRHARSGTLWEGRYRSTLIESERYLLACMVYIDLNPVRAGLAARAADYPWSSHGYHVGQRSDKRITPHPLYWALGNTPFAREAAYAALVQAGVAQATQRELVDATRSGWALGSAPFIAQLQAQSTRRVSKGQAGRPPSPVLRKDAETH